MCDEGLFVTLETAPARPPEEYYYMGQCSPGAFDGTCNNEDSRLM